MDPKLVSAEEYGILLEEFRKADFRKADFLAERKELQGMRTSKKRRARIAELTELIKECGATPRPVLVSQILDEEVIPYLDRALDSARGVIESFAKTVRESVRYTVSWDLEGVCRAEHRIDLLVEVKRVFLNVAPEDWVESFEQLKREAMRGLRLRARVSQSTSPARTFVANCEAAEFAEMLDSLGSHPVSGVFSLVARRAERGPWYDDYNTPGRVVDERGTGDIPGCNS